MGSRKPGSQAIVTGLLIVAGLLAIVETLARAYIPRLGHIEGRVAREYRSVHEAPKAGQRTLLAVGNSMLLHGVDFPQFQSGLPAGWEARRFVVEATQYTDWYYGLRRLFNEGVTCDALMVTLSPRYLTGSLTRGSYFARRLMRPQDFYLVAHDLDMTPTQTTDLLFSSLSEFHGLRAELRTLLLSALIPHMNDLTGKMNAAPAVLPNPQEMHAIALKRLTILRDLAAANHAKLILFMPPFREGSDGAEAVLRAGTEVGVPVLWPIPSGTLSPSVFEDAVHMNPAGAAILTPALLRDLKKFLPQ